MSTELLLGVVLGILLTLGVQQLGKTGRGLTSPGCLLVIFLIVGGGVLLVATGVISLG